VLVAIALLLAAFFAGLVDAVMGGGGLLQLPALLALLPAAAPAALLGTNKLAASVGTAGAALTYGRSIRPPWPMIAPGLLLAFVGSALGATVAVALPVELMRKALPFVLTLLLLASGHPQLGLEHAPAHTAGSRTWIATAGAALIGFYDGLLGPGTGVFLKLLYVRLLGFGFLNAAAPAKLTNLASNLAAFLVFAHAGQVLWYLGLAMAVANWAGGQVGARLALRQGNRFLRQAFLLVVGALIVKTSWDAYGPR
jgi:uncharacterized membrane protein YfcA